MAMLPRAANTEDNNEGMRDMSPIPAGKYAAHIVSSELKQTKAKTGQYLSLLWKVIHGPYTGRTIFVNLNLNNPSKVAEEIAMKEMNSICKACNMEGVQDSAEIHNIPVCITVAIDSKPNSDYPPQNKIVAYDDIDEYEAFDDGPGDHSANDDSGQEPVKEPAKEQPKGRSKAKLPWEKK